VPKPATLADVRRVHTAKHLERFAEESDFDADTAWFPGILGHALRAAGGAADAMRIARHGERSFSLMRPPGHHASAGRAMGFCYLNSIVVAAQAALADGCERVAIWDFDAHHGNGTEDLVRGDERIEFSSVHQSPGWPGTGAESQGNIYNFTVPPRSQRAFHMEKLGGSLAILLKFKPDLLLVSAGFDAFAEDPITEMTLAAADFEELGRWLHPLAMPVACVLEGGYSSELPQLIAGFLCCWENG